ncbi:type VI secretion system-associated lipoprotein [Paraburkholderia ginsengiterrae]|uniref:Type VI secretion system-associated lipoprotein n=1 Tax=Paraburkholderia ginsengiterrae TaxID=1462993 RepID=A0A1A9N0G5_9BURK|nr:type VI secretion system lipoprotein TssJ [Paraburkholderia ginsengiterrae]OAJ55196.1 type VI secretion system-associated lipoprotein [Paraburkholderia ginsengiterrae]OAJ58677.1 type VI secretion system-associated lipoprotein [Paraburkholderia ginsengiterrae]
MFVRLSAPLLAASLLLSACGAWQSVSDSTASAYHAVFYKQVKVLNVDLTARASLNPDEANRSTSVAVRVYQLKDRKLFDKASYDDLLKNDKTVLAQDLQDSMATVVNPGASASVTQPMQPDAEYVGIVAFYRKPDANGTWRRIVQKKRLSADAPLKLELVDRELVATTDPVKSRPE